MKTHETNIVSYNAAMTEQKCGQDDNNDVSDT